MTTELSLPLRERIENTIRGLTIDAVEAAACGHPGAPMGLARPVFLVWDRHLRFDPRDPEWPLRDRFVLSAGHASMLLYSLLHLWGYDLPIEEVKRFRQLGSRTPGHPEFGHTAGVETTTGPLGQGFSNGVGMALAGRMTRSRFSRGTDGPGHHLVYGVVSDGDLMEGISYESASLAGHWGLGNLVYLYDDNDVTIDGPASLAFSEDVGKRFEAMRWHVQRVDGQDVEAVDRALSAAREETERPSLLITKTVIGYGSPNLAGDSKTHGAALGAEEARLTKENLGWPLEPEFLVPDDVRSYMTERIAAKRKERAEIDAGLERWRTANPEVAAEWEAFRSKRVPRDLRARVVGALADAKEDATRKYSGAALAALAEPAPFLIGGSGDLTPSNNTLIPGSDRIGPASESGDPFLGRYIHYGIREHAMGGITNGIALDGTFLPYTGTFLVFSDYMRPSVRLSAVMGIRSIWVFTHDSIFTGEDGPTHQPVEHLDALRAIPGLTVFRPADPLETAETWAWTVEHAEGPVLFAFSRQKAPHFERGRAFDADDVLRGGYVVSQSGEIPDVVLLATGSEVSLAAAAAARLSDAGVGTRVVSMPCVSRFLEQDPAYRASVVPEDGTPVFAVEAGRGESLRRFTGPRGLVYGVDRFGASAPVGDLAEAFGFTAEKLTDRIQEHLRRV